MIRNELPVISVSHPELCFNCRRGPRSASAGFRGCCRTLQGGELPSLAKEGWPRHQENGAKPPLKERPGWFVQLPIIGGFNEPPRLRQPRKLRDIFFMGAATPPLPRRGVPAHCNVRQQPHEEEIALAQRFSIHSQQ